MLNKVLSEFSKVKELDEVIPFGSGLINNTWLIKNETGDFILQRINHNVFKQPEAIADNIKNIAHYFAVHSPNYLFVTPEKTIKGDELVFIKEEGFYRLFPFIKNSHTIDVVNTTSQAYEAARQFGRFTKLLSGFNAASLHITLPDFHNLSLRYQQFESALQHGNAARIKETADTIKYLQQHHHIVDAYDAIRKNPDFKIRVTHHDTKISNVLFDDNNKGICVIDLDTVMPGYFISDVGDMMRTYLSPVSEEEKDFSKIEIRNDYFKAIADGYLAEMKDELTAAEKAHFVYAGKFLIYMQALRFLADYINNDIYYGSKYEGHNFIRAKNQVVLLQRLMEKENELMALLC